MGHGMHRPMVETKVKETRNAQRLDCRDMEFTDRRHKSIACSLDYSDPGVVQTPVLLDSVM